MVGRRGARILKRRGRQALGLTPVLGRGPRPTGIGSAVHGMRRERSRQKDVATGGIVYYSSPSCTLLVLLVYYHKKNIFFRTR